MPRRPVPTVVRKLTRKLAENRPSRVPCGAARCSRRLNCGHRCQHDPQTRHGTSASRVATGEDAVPASERGAGRFGPPARRDSSEMRAESPRTRSSWSIRRGQNEPLAPPLYLGWMVHRCAKRVGRPPGQAARPLVQDAGGQARHDLERGRRAKEGSPERDVDAIS